MSQSPPLSPILAAETTEAVLDAVKNSGSSFLLGMLSLPEKRRMGMFALYAFCRAVDDIADEDDDAARRLRTLEEWRGYVADLFKGRAAHPVIQLLQAPLLDFDLREQDFHAIIDGMEMDARGPIQRPSWEQLDQYCDCVASAVGRVSVRIFGEATPQGREVAHHLGRALQLTNILRDLDEDAARQRLYLPREALDEAGITATDITAILAHPAIDHTCRAVARRAVYHFDEAAAAMEKCSRRAIKPARLMRDYYAPLLRAMLMAGWDAPRTRVSLRPMAKLGLLLKSFLP